MRSPRTRRRTGCCVEAHRVLKPGGHAVFVIRARRIGPWPLLAEITRRDGLGAALQRLLWGLATSIFEAAREPSRTARLGRGHVLHPGAPAGFALLDMRRTFLGGASLLVWARKSAEALR